MYVLLFQTLAAINSGGIQTKEARDKVFSSLTLTTKGGRSSMSSSEVKNVAAAVTSLVGGSSSSSKRKRRAVSSSTVEPMTVDEVSNFHTQSLTLSRLT